MSEREHNTVTEDDTDTTIEVPKVLVIAGPYDAEKIRARLSEAGFDVLVFNGHDQPITHATNHELQCVVLSLRLSGIEPRKLLQELRQALGSEVPIVLVAGRVNDELTLEDVVSMGANQLAGRPLDPDELLAKMEEVLAQPSEVSLAETTDEPTDEQTETTETTEASDFEVDDATPTAFDTPTSTDEAINISAASTGRWKTGGERHEGDTLGRWQWSPEQVEDDQRGESVEAEESRGDLGDEVPTIAVELPRAGRLDEIGLPTLFDRIRRAGFSGRLSLSCDETTKTVHFDAGLPVVSRSSSQADRIEHMLLREGKLSVDQCETCQQQQPELSGQQMGTALVERGLLRQDELFPVVRRHVAEIIYSLFSWSTGSFVLEARQTSPSESVRLQQHPRALVLEGIRRKCGLDRLVELVGGPSTKSTPPSGSEEAFAQAELSEAEQETLVLLDGTRTLQDVIDDGPLDQLQLYQLVYGLSALGLMDGKAARYGVKSSSELAIDRQRVLRKHAQVCQGNYFALLGLSLDATRHEVDRACDEMKAAFDPYRVPPEIADEFSEQLGEIGDVVEEARRILADDYLRKAYRETLI